MWRNNFVILIDGKLAQEFWTPGCCLTGGFFHSRGTKWGNQTLIKRKIDINKESSGMHCANKIWTGPPNILLKRYGGSQGSELKGHEEGREGGRGVKTKRIHFLSSIKWCILGVCSGATKRTSVRLWTVRKRKKYRMLDLSVTSALWSAKMCIGAPHLRSPAFVFMVVFHF